MKTLAALSLSLFLGCGASSAPPPAAPPAESAPAPQVAQTAPAAPAADQPSASEIRTAAFHSDALGVDKQYVIYLPRGYASDTSKRWPVIYMLHGLGGAETNWRDLGIGKVADSLDLAAIIVMPDGDDGFYSDWVAPVDYDKCLKTPRPFGKEIHMEHYCVKQPRYDQYISHDLIGHTDATYRTLADRAHRAIGGLSMGGYGAFYQAFHHPELFSAVASHAGVASLLYEGPHPYAPGKAEISSDPRKFLAESGDFGVLFRKIWGEGIARWRQHDPVTLTANLTPGQMAIYFDVGTADEFHLQDANQYLDEVLTKRGLEHEFHLVEGGHHDGAFWSSRVNDSLRFLQAHLGGRE